jgi:hypothetical protein
MLVQMGFAARDVATVHNLAEGVIYALHLSMHCISRRMAHQPNDTAAGNHVPVHTWGNTRTWERGSPALVASTMARCPRYQEKCGHLQLRKSKTLCESLHPLAPPQATPPPLLIGIPFGR